MLVKQGVGQIVGIDQSRTLAHRNEQGSRHRVVAEGYDLVRVRRRITYELHGGTSSLHFGSHRGPPRAKELESLGNKGPRHPSEIFILELDCGAKRSPKPTIIRTDNREFTGRMPAGFDVGQVVQVECERLAGHVANGPPVARRKDNLAPCNRPGLPAHRIELGRRPI